MNVITVSKLWHMIFLTIIWFTSCSSKNNNDNLSAPWSTIDVSDFDIKESFDTNFAVSQYLCIVDSILSSIIGERPLLVIDSTASEHILFNEIDGMLIELLTSNMRHGIRYDFLFDGKRSIYKQSLIFLTFDTERAADSIFAVIRDVALKKSGVPGLTYCNDYLTKQRNELYWVHSSCSFSYKNHYKFVNALKCSLNYIGGLTLHCKCGEVTCKEIFESP
jgi:hypothetical protein